MPVAVRYPQKPCTQNARKSTGKAKVVTSGDLNDKATTTSTAKEDDPAPKTNQQAVEESTEQAGPSHVVRDALYTTVSQAVRQAVPILYNAICCELNPLRTGE
jgi:hypothetical protein